MAQTPQQRFDEEYNNKAFARRENDATLLPRLIEIQQGRDIESLAQFAKAYLGLFLDMDNSIGPADRLRILANPLLEEAIWQGFAAALLRDDLAAPATIADSLVAEQPLDMGYVMLAGIDRLTQDNPAAALALPDKTLVALICFYYANQTTLADQWLTYIVQHKQNLVAAALTAFWQQLITRDLDYLPGLYPIISYQANDNITRQLVLPILRNWRHCRKKILRDILHVALRVADSDPLLAVAQQALENWNQNEPARYALWLGTAFLLAPAEYEMVLADYMGRSRERILPLLDFVVMVLMTDDVNRYDLPGRTFAQLLRIIAPKFTPQVDRQGNVCDNTQKVMYLFYRLAVAEDADAGSAIKRLRLVRVMKLYAEVLAEVQAVQALAVKPGFEVFVAALINDRRIKAKRNWSDLS